MIQIISRFENLLQTGTNYISKCSHKQLKLKHSPEKWSKKEILGHLIDSAINNLQRFTEIQYKTKPYKIRNYDQNKLVKVNDYQNIDLNDLTSLWVGINKQILYLIRRQTEDSLNYKIETDKGNISDLRFLIEDYINHLEHHLNQIVYDKK